jgi:hypothetical protein
LTFSSSRIAGSSSTTRIVGIILRDLGANLLGRGMAHVHAPNDLNRGLRDVLGVIADAFDRLGDEDDLERRGNRARVLHHVADQLPQHR